MNFPPSLQSGDTVAIVAPAGKVTAGSLDAAINELTAWGLQVQLGAHVYDQENYFAGHDAARLADLQQAIDNPGVKAILCARGGYGITRILHRINFTSLVRHPKWVIGFSDITALHLQLQKLAIASIHGPMGTSLGQQAYTTSALALRQLLFNRTLPEVLGNGGQEGAARGRITGGNLSLLVDSLGTANEVDTAGRILFIEEVGEKTYRVDRMLQQLLRAGKLDNLAGMVVGHFTAIDDGDTPFGLSWQQVVLDITRQFTYPVGMGFAIGHAAQNMPVVVGGHYRLQVTTDGAALTWNPQD